MQYKGGVYIKRLRSALQAAGQRADMFLQPCLLFSVDSLQSGLFGQCEMEPLVTKLHCSLFYLLLLFAFGGIFCLNRQDLLE